MQDVCRSEHSGPDDPVASFTSIRLEDDQPTDRRSAMAGRAPMFTVRPLSAPADSSVDLAPCHLCAHAPAAQASVLPLHPPQEAAPASLSAAGSL